MSRYDDIKRLAQRSRKRNGSGKSVKAQKHGKGLGKKSPETKR